MARHLLIGVALACTSGGALAANFCSVTPTTMDCRYTTLAACERTLLETRGQCLANPEVLPTPPPRDTDVTPPAKVTTLPPPPAPFGTPLDPDSWRKGVDVGKTILEEQSKRPGEPGYLVLYQCPMPGGGVVFSAAMQSAGCTIIHLQQY
ncbi:MULTISPECIES: hypothetical protein [Lysobacteraceae]|nr:MULTISPECIES: hypothetical protein [Lysobacter]